MAIALEDKVNVESPSVRYPEGRIKDNPGDGTGTPVDVNTYGDFHQFFARLLVEGSVIPNGIFENAYDGFQYIEALKKMIGKIVLDIGDWNMFSNANPVTFSIPLTIDRKKVRGVKVIIKSDDLGAGDYTLLPLEMGGHWVINNLSSGNSITLSRDGGGQFQAVNYQNTSWNRGWIEIDYVP